MDANERNLSIAKYLQLTEVKPNVFKMDSRFKNLCPYKETSELKFDRSFDWLMLAVQEIEKIKDLTVCIQANFVALYYKGEEINGEIVKPTFSCQREKTSKLSSLFEVTSNFILFLQNNPEIESDVEYELHHVEEDRIQVYVPLKD